MGDAGNRIERDTMKRAKLAEILRNDYVQIAILVVIVVVSAVAFWFGLRTALKTGYPLLAVASGSMRPTLQVGDLIVVQGVNAGDIKAAPKDAPEPGDIIVFHKPTNPRELIVHRAVEKFLEDGTWYFKTWGDNNIGPDNWELPETNVIGKAIGPSVPLLGYVTLFVQSPLGIPVIVSIVLVLALVEYVSLRKKESVA